jgi:hypothetical protein
VTPRPFVLLVACGLAACGSGVPTTLALTVDADAFDYDNAFIALHLISGTHSTHANGRLDVWIDGIDAPHASSTCHIVLDVADAQFGPGDVGADLTVPFPPGCDANVPGRTPPYAVYATFTTSDGAVVHGDGGCGQFLANRITYRPPASPPVVPAAPSTLTTTASCNTPIAGSCEEWTLPADQLEGPRATCSGANSAWALAGCPRSGALGRCVMATETIYYYQTLDEAEPQCGRYGGTYATLP